MTSCSTEVGPRKNKQVSPTFLRQKKWADQWRVAKSTEEWHAKVPNPVSLIRVQRKSAKSVGRLAKPLQPSGWKAPDESREH